MYKNTLVYFINTLGDFMKFKKIYICIYISNLLLISCGKNNDSIYDKEKYISTNNKDNSQTIKNWELPELSYDEKENLVFAVKTVFNDFYVNRLQKINDFNYDALKEANKLSSKMPSNQLLSETMKIFRNIRDLHTGFIYPVPARCISSHFPLTTKLVYNEAGEDEKLIVVNKNDKYDFHNTFYNENYSKIKLGDEIVSIKNIGLEEIPSYKEFTAKDALNEIGKFYRGANSEAYISRAVQNFFNRNGAYMQPAEGVFNVRIRHKEDKSESEFRFPWLKKQSATPECATQLNSYTDSLNIKYLKYNKVIDTEENFTRFGDGDNVTISKLEKNGKLFALIHLNYFIPSSEYNFYNYLEAREKINEEINGIKKYINDNKNDLAGIIFDVRGNGGGYGSYAQLLANLFTNTFVKNMLVKPLVSQVNRDTFYNLEMSRYVSRKGTTDPLSTPVLDTVNLMDKFINGKFTKESVAKREIILEEADRYDGDENDALPSFYSKETTEILKPVLTNKPIAILTNSNCYSACDVFTSIFKDYKIARIYGETRQTGGGGANVIEWNDFLEPVTIDEKGTRTTMIPNARPLPKGSEIRFAWNKIKRPNNTKYEQYIEGVGVIADYIYKPTEEDALNNSKRILNKIMDDMLDPFNSKKFYLNR